MLLPAWLWSDSFHFPASLSLFPAHLFWTQQQRQIDCEDQPVHFLNTFLYLARIDYLFQPDSIKVESQSGQQIIKSIRQKMQKWNHQPVTQPEVSQKGIDSE